MATRELNLKRISAIHKAMRWAAIGVPMSDEWSHMTLGTLSSELRARMQLEHEYTLTDPTPVFIVTKPASPPIDPRLN